jgi:citrate lyase beta subunit
MLSPYSLGATLYMPATRDDLWIVASGQKIPTLRSLVICLEDAVSDNDISMAINHLQLLLHRLAHEERSSHAPLLFVRPRNIQMAAKMADWSYINQIDGIVLPKFDLGSMRAWHKVLPSNMLLLPTLETAEIYDAYAMRELRQALQYDFPPVLTLRIGGNDLLACLGLRRPAHQTLYQTPLGGLIAMLVGNFVPHGFALTSPVCEYFQDPTLLKQELAIDIQHGLVGKTIIHPSQIEHVHAALEVKADEYHAAQAILKPDAHAVFSFEGAMLEPATHRAWAQRICERATYYGVKDLQSPNLIAWPRKVIQRP